MSAPVFGVSSSLPLVVGLVVGCFGVSVGSVVVPLPLFVVVVSSATT